MRIPNAMPRIDSPKRTWISAKQLQSKSKAYQGKQGAGMGGRIRIKKIRLGLFLPQRQISVISQFSKMKFMPRSRPTATWIKPVKIKKQVKSATLPLKWCSSRLLRIRDRYQIEIMVAKWVSSPIKSREVNNRQYQKFKCAYLMIHEYLFPVEVEISVGNEVESDKHRERHSKNENSSCDGRNLLQEIIENRHFQLQSRNTMKFFHFYRWILFLYFCSASIKHSYISILLQPEIKHNIQQYFQYLLQVGQEQTNYELRPSDLVM